MTTDPLIVTHSLPLRGADPEKLAAALAVGPGIHEVRAEEDGLHIAITYDIRRASLDDVERALVEAGATEPAGLIEKIRLAWTRFTEENTRVSVTTPYRECCNKPPVIPK